MTLTPAQTQFLKSFFESTNREFQVLDAWYFCDNEFDANDCAQLVVKGEKRASSSSLWWHEASKEPLPKIGDLNLVTDWYANPIAIIETTKIDIVPYHLITAEYAKTEGEGDKSLAYWQKVHWAYYHRELAPFGMTPTKDMPIVCEQFRCIYAK